MEINPACAEWAKDNKIAFMNPQNWLQGKHESEDFVALSLCLLDELSMIRAVNFQPLILTAANISDSWKSLCLSKISVLLQMDSLIIAWGWILASFQRNLFYVWNTHMRQRRSTWKDQSWQSRNCMNTYKSSSLLCICNCFHSSCFHPCWFGVFFLPSQHTFLLQSRQPSLNRHWYITGCQPMVSQNQTCYLQGIRYPQNFKFIPFAPCFTLLQSIWWP